MTDTDLWLVNDKIVKMAEETQDPALAVVVGIMDEIYRRHFGEDGPSGRESKQLTAEERRQVMQGKWERAS